MCQTRNADVRLLGVVLPVLAVLRLVLRVVPEPEERVVQVPELEADVVEEELHPVYRQHWFP
jgi:hypothetical protein